MDLSFDDRREQEKREEEEDGEVLSINGGIVVGKKMSSSFLFEGVRIIIGEEKGREERREGEEGEEGEEEEEEGVGSLLGEVVKVDRDLVTIQVYDETRGLKIGSRIIRTREPLSVELGPGLLGSIYDGLQKPLQLQGELFLPKVGSSSLLSSLDKNKKWHFVPCVKINDLIYSGDVFGSVKEMSINHQIMVPPPPPLPSPPSFRSPSSSSFSSFSSFSLSSPSPIGKVTFIAQEGEYTIKDTLLLLSPTIEEGKKREPLKYGLSHKWPLRKPRPVRERVKRGKEREGVREEESRESEEKDVPLFTGYRVLDCLFPVPLGGTVSIPKMSGQSTIFQMIAINSNCDITIYLNCGGRSTEVSEAVECYPELLKREEDGKRGSVMKKMVLIANSANMNLAAREYSIYTGFLIAEYYRDMGYNTLLMGDSLTRWGEALRETSNRMGEMPGEEGYPPSLPSKLANVFERAGKTVSMGTPLRKGSLTFVATISAPPGGYSTDSIIDNSLPHSQSCWVLDNQLARKKHFPAINWNMSWSKCWPFLKEYYNRRIEGQKEKGEMRKREIYYEEMRKKVFEILDEESNLMEVVIMRGKENLSKKEKVVFYLARFIREDFLTQNIFTLSDRFCSIVKGLLMLKNLILFYDLAMKEMKKDEISFDEWIQKTEIESILESLHSMKELENENALQNLQDLEEIILLFQLMNE